jgi:hypothetical protein
LRRREEHALIVDMPFAVGRCALGEQLQGVRRRRGTSADGRRFPFPSRRTGRTRPSLAKRPSPAGSGCSQRLAIAERHRPGVAFHAAAVPPTATCRMGSLSGLSADGSPTNAVPCRGQCRPACCRR